MYIVFLIMLQPTTKAPTLPPGSTVLLACGSSGGGCSGQTQTVANLNESHEVRCCREGALGNWDRRYNTCPSNIWGESDFSNGVGCVDSATYNEAQQICSNAGGRLCTAAELLADCTRGSGCSHDQDMIWSSTPGTTPSPTTANVSVVFFYTSLSMQKLHHNMTSSNNILSVSFFLDLANLSTNT